MNFGHTEGLLPPTLLDAARRYAQSGAGLTDYPAARALSYADLARAAENCIEALQACGLTSGDTLFHLFEDRLDFLPLLVACEAAGVGLVLCPADATRAHAALALRHSGAKLAVGAAAIRDASANRYRGARWLCTQEQEAFFARPLSEPFAPDHASRAVGVAEAAPRAGPVWLTAGAMRSTVINFAQAYPVGAGDRILSASSPLTLQGLCSSVVIPLMLGASVVFVDGALLDRPAAIWHAAMRTGATICELPAEGFERLLRHDEGQSRDLSPALRFLLCGSGILPDATRLAAERAWSRRIYDGYGAPPVGFWLASRPYEQMAPALSVAAGSKPSPTFSIRRLRKQLALLSPAEADAAEHGEILLHDDDAKNGRPKPQRTGDLGALATNGDLVVFDRLTNVAVREGRAILTTDIDRVLAGNKRIHGSKTFHEHGNRPGEPLICACVTDLDPAEIRSWLAERVDRLWTPDQIVRVGRIPAGPGLLGAVARLRNMVSGGACNDVVAGLTARRFRRNQPHQEAELRAVVQEAVLGFRPLQFLMFWGCGPRRNVCEPELAAVAAVHVLLNAVRCAAPIETPLDIIFGDVHAASNGRAPDHFHEYFEQMERVAASPGITFRRQSELWDGAGLTLAGVRALGATAAFEEKWRQFPRRDRFITEASRHSKTQDRDAAARQNYSICSLERELLKEAYPDAVFLTYDGPEFNECAPDLPTLYLYPGPRGRFGTPWFARGPGRKSPAISRPRFCPSRADIQAPRPC